MSYMIGVDVGGTFTDFSVFEHETGRLFHFKHSSTNYDSSVAIVDGIARHDGLHECVNREKGGPRGTCHHGRL